MSHPCQWTPAIIDVLREQFQKRGVVRVHDPFGGTGVRLGALCDESGILFTATDLEAWPDSDPRVARYQSATDQWAYPWYHDDSDDLLLWIVTSPVYPNGMADHFDAKDTSRRHTYRAALGQELHKENAGRYSVRQGKKSEAKYWEIQEEAVQHWPNQVMVNVSDFIHNGAIYQLVEQWEELLLNYGYQEQERIEIPTPRQRHGANGDLRVPTESLLIYTK